MLQEMGNNNKDQIDTEHSNTQNIYKARGVYQDHKD